MPSAASSPRTEYERFGEDDGDVETIRELLTELRKSQEPGCLVTKVGNLRLVNQGLATALAEIAACLDERGVDITWYSVHGNDVDWFARARYVADVAFGRRRVYPDVGVVGEWVGLHCH